MTDLFRPGDERAGSVMSNGALLAAMVRVEAAWLQVLVDARIAPEAAADELAGLVDPSGDDIGTIAAARRPAKHHTGSTTSALPPQPAWRGHTRHAVMPQFRAARLCRESRVRE